MGEDPSAGRAPGATVTAPTHPPEDPAQLRADIERTRQDLGDTVAALAEKTDVKARAKEKVAEVRRNVSGKRTELRHNVSEKRTELMDRARGTSPDSAGSAAVRVRAQTVRVRAKAKANPVPTAALAALAGGFLLGRFTKRR